ncbi:hypothetical protein [uncultured Kordia sp.]|uniref:hypothetical protein n=1 Tax=uncultured Kordia sp. TaxID=507699 RepID=UPI00262A9438|nr:hypothetical protein [uncultured Kordia sp.]
MRTRSKHTKPIYKLLGVVFLIAFAIGTWIIWSYSIKKSKIELNKDVAFEANRTILKMKKDSLVMILSKWQAEKPKRFSKVEIEDNWIVWSYNKRYQKGIMLEIFGDEATYKRDSTVFKNDIKNLQLRFKAQADTAYVYVRLITQYYSVLDQFKETSKVKSRKSE